MRPETFVRTLSTWSPSGTRGRRWRDRFSTMRRGALRRSIRTGRLAFLAGLSATALFLLATGVQAAPSLEAVLQKMDSAAADWKGMRAKMESVRYDSLVDDSRVESGRIAVRTTNSGSVQMLVEFQEPSAQFISVRQERVEIYKPRIKTVEEYDIREHSERVENALLLGFGTAGSYLREHYEIVLDGEQSVVGQSTVKLDLQPRNPNGDLNNSPMEMWISTTHWQPVQQKMYDRNSSDYRLSVYWDVEINPTFRAGEFRLPLARGTKRVRPQR